MRQTSPVGTDAPDRRQDVRPARCGDPTVHQPLFLGRRAGRPQDGEHRVHHRLSHPLGNEIEQSLTQAQAFCRQKLGESRVCHLLPIGLFLQPSAEGRRVAFAPLGEDASPLGKTNIAAVSRRSAICASSSVRSFRASPLAASEARISRVTSGLPSRTRPRFSRGVRFDFASRTSMFRGEARRR